MSEVRSFEVFDEEGSANNITHCTATTLHLLTPELPRKAVLNGDMRNVSRKQLSKAFVQDVLKDWLKMTQDHYPETVKVIYFNKPPKVIRAVWAVVARFVSKSTQEKVVMVSAKRGPRGPAADPEAEHVRIE